MNPLWITLRLYTTITLGIYIALGELVNLPKKMDYPTQKYIL